MCQLDSRIPEQPMTMRWWTVSLEARGVKAVMWRGVWGSTDTPVHR